jgi:hypothetical protein
MHEGFGQTSPEHTDDPSRDGAFRTLLFLPAASCTRTCTKLDVQGDAWLVIKAATSVSEM